MAVRPASLLHDRASAAPAGRVLSSRSTWFLRGRADWQPRHRGRPFLCGTPVLLVDFSSDALPYLVKYDPVTPGFRTAKEWLQSVTGDRLAPPKKGMRIRHRPKRATNAQLAEQLGSLLTGLPSGPRGASSQGAGSVDCSASGSEGRSTRRENSRRRTDRGWEPPRRCRGVGRRGLDLRQPRRALRPLGGFGSQKSLGIVFWLLSNIADCLVKGDVASTEELTALSLAAVEQCAQDGGSWEVGHFITLLEDPPHQLFQHRPASANPRLRAFGGLTPQTWATTTLSYIRELDLIQSRRTEAVNHPKPKGPPASEVRRLAGRGSRKSPKRRLPLSSAPSFALPLKP